MNSLPIKQLLIVKLPQCQKGTAPKTADVGSIIYDVSLGRPISAPKQHRGVTVRPSFGTIVF